MIQNFRQRYPQGELLSELVQFDRDFCVIHAMIRVDGLILASSFASGDSVEVAEDKAFSRAFDRLYLKETHNPEIPPTPQPLIHSQKEISLPPEETSPPETLLQPSLTITAPPLNSPLDPSLNHHQATLSPENIIPSETYDFTEIINQTSLEIKRLQWTDQQAKDYLTTTYGKRSRQLLSDEELIHFLKYLESQPTPTETPKQETPPPSSTLEIIPENPPLISENSSEIVTPFSPTIPAMISDTTVMDFSEIMDKTAVEMKRLNWTDRQGREYLLSTYGKRSRQLLSDEELVEFLHYLESQP